MNLRALCVSVVKKVNHGGTENTEKKNPTDNNIKKPHAESGVVFKFVKVFF